MRILQIMRICSAPTAHPEIILVHISIIIMTGPQSEARHVLCEMHAHCISEAVCILHVHFHFHDLDLQDGSKSNQLSCLWQSQPLDQPSM